MTYEGERTIHETPGVCGGYPCIGHTRIPVRCVVEVWQRTDLAHAAAMFPQLTEYQITAALDYYHAHPARVDEDIERNALTIRQLVADGCPQGGVKKGKR